jgi:sugar porter (SP) family MFS transporter
MFGAGGLIGAVLGPKVIGHFVGRKTTLLVNNVFLFASCYLMAFGSQWYYMAMGRVLVGIVAGVATAVVPTYLSEISPIAIRGAVSTMHQLGITVGILVSQVLSTPSLKIFGSEEKWQWLFLVPALCGLLELMILPFMPGSPSYLFQTQGKGAARKALARLQSPEVVDEYISYIEQEIYAEKSSGGSSVSVLGLFGNRSLRKQLIVGITVQLMMQFSGIDAVFYYSTTVFYQADVPDPELATTLLGVINVLITIVAVKYMDSAGRKTLLIWSWYGMCTSYVVLTLSFIAKPYIDIADSMSVVAMTGVISFFAFGPGCIAWFIIAETFSLNARDSAMALGIAINWVANWLVAFSFPLLLSVAQPYTFLVFVATTLYFLIFTYRFVPETKGKTIAQVTEAFEYIDLPTC